ncbi:FAD assembly factor SdhE [Chitinibacteraceae bacterium HSL-7]
MDETEKKRVIWRSRRGLLELDLQLQRFVATGLPQLTDQEWDLYRELLQLPDNDLLDILNERVECRDTRLVPVIKRIQAS